MLRSEVHPFFDAWWNPAATDDGDASASSTSALSGGGGARGGAQIKDANAAPFPLRRFEFQEGMGGALGSGTEAEGAVPTDPGALRPPPLVRRDGVPVSV